MAGTYCGSDYCLGNYMEGENTFRDILSLPVQANLAVDTIVYEGIGVKFFLRGYADTSFGVKSYIYRPVTEGFQCKGFVDTINYTGLGVKVYLMGYADTSFGVKSYIDKTTVEGVGVKGFINKITACGISSKVFIRDYLYTGIGTRAFIDKANVLGISFTSIRRQMVGIQFRAFTYNVRQLRILHDFKSRGLTSVDNWVVSSTASGDFEANNLNSDIVEHVWRSDAETLVTLDCDTQVPQGVIVDTVAIINHNMTRGARLYLRGSNTEDFSILGHYSEIEVFNNNIFHCIPLPSQASFPLLRYWRFEIQDATNPDGYIQIGAIVFGSCDLFSLKENFDGRVVFEKRVYTDKVATEGFTNVENIRNRCNVLSLRFKDLRVDGSNYRMMSDIFEKYMTTHKLCVIPYPAAPQRFSVFAKLEDLPIENHSQEGEALVDFNLTLNESL